MFPLTLELEALVALRTRSSGSLALMCPTCASALAVTARSLLDLRAAEAHRASTEVLAAILVKAVDAEKPPTEDAVRKEVRIETLKLLDRSILKVPTGCVRARTEMTPQTWSGRVERKAKEKGK